MASSVALKFKKSILLDRVPFSFDPPNVQIWASPEDTLPDMEGSTADPARLRPNGREDLMRSFGARRRDREIFFFPSEKKVFPFLVIR